MTTSLAPAKVGAPCPACGFPQVTVASAVPWCAACGWNLDQYSPDRRGRDFDWRWSDRWGFRTAYRLNREQFATLAGQPVDRPSLGAAGWFTMVFGALSALFIAAAIGSGIWLCTVDFPGFALIGGIGLIALGVLLLPRPGRIAAHAHVIAREQAPTLWRLVDEIADAVGTRRADLIVVDQRYNASVRTVGPRRRRAVGLGVPLWGSLGPQERVAVLGHEFGHYVNGDIRRGPVTGLAFSTLARLSRAIRPPRRANVRRGLLELLVRVVERTVLGTLSALLRWGQAGVIMIGLGSIRRAEYYADDIASRVGGSEATSRLLDALTNTEVNMTLIQSAIRAGKPVAEWQRTVADAQRELRPSLAARRQLTHRTDAGIFASHPPTGMRAALVDSRPAQTARIVLTTADSARIDEELAVPYARFVKDVTLG